jgi:hypothetical protein
MESLNFLFSRLSTTASSTHNFILERISKFRPRAPQPDIEAILRHQATLLRSFRKYLYPWQIDEITRYYQRSTINEESILEDFFHGDNTKHTVPKDEHYYSALEYTRQRFAPPRKCRPAHLLDVQHHYHHKNKSNAEPPFSTEPFYLDILRSEEYRNKRDLPENPKASTGNMKDIIFDYTREWHHKIKDGTAPVTSYLFYMLLHSKTALIKENDPNKIRTIWGTPKPFVLAEIIFHWSLLAHYKRNPGLTPMLWGYETILGGWFRLNAELFTKHMRTSIVTLDYSRFDKYAPFSVFDDLDDMTRSFLDFDNGYLPTYEYPHTDTTWDSTKSQRLERLWEWTKYAFRNTPIVLPDGRVYTRTHSGIPSGLYTTQYRDSIYNHLKIATVLFAMGFTPQNLMLLKVQGDDSITQLSILVPPNEHTAFLQKYSETDAYYFGSVVNPDKSAIHNKPNGCTVLGYTNHNGLPHRDQSQLLAQFYHTKSSKPTPSKTMAACVGFAYASCGFERQLYRICSDVYNYYESKGFTPDATALGEYLYSDPLTDIRVKLTHFPSIPEIQGTLLSYSYAPPATMQQFFPESWFLDTA